MSRCYSFWMTDVSVGDFKSSNTECIISVSAATLLQWLIMLSQRPNVVTMWLHSVITWAQIYVLLAIYTLASNPTGSRVLLHSVIGIVKHCRTSTSRKCSSNIWEKTTASMSHKFCGVRSMRSIITSLAHSLLSYCWERLSMAPTCSQQTTLACVHMWQMWHHTNDDQTTKNEFKKPNIHCHCRK